MTRASHRAASHSGPELHFKRHTTATNTPVFIWTIFGHSSLRSSPVAPRLAPQTSPRTATLLHQTTCKRCKAPVATQQALLLSHLPTHSSRGHTQPQADHEARLQLRRPEQRAPQRHATPGRGYDSCLARTSDNDCDRRSRPLIVRKHSAHSTRSSHLHGRSVCHGHPLPDVPSLPAPGEALEAVLHDTAAKAEPAADATSGKTLGTVRRNGFGQRA